jgi:hypothetical protein
VIVLFEKRRDDAVTLTEIPRRNVNRSLPCRQEISGQATDRCQGLGWGKLPSQGGHALYPKYLYRLRSLSCSILARMGTWPEIPLHDGIQSYRGRGRERNISGVSRVAIYVMHGCRRDAAAEG